MEKSANEVLASPSEELKEEADQPQGRTGSVQVDDEKREDNNKGDFDNQVKENENFPYDGSLKLSSSEERMEEFISLDWKTKTSKDDVDNLQEKVKAVENGEVKMHLRPEKGERGYEALQKEMEHSHRQKNTTTGEPEGLSEVIETLRDGRDEHMAEASEDELQAEVDLHKDPPSWSEKSPAGALKSALREGLETVSVDDINTKSYHSSDIKDTRLTGSNGRGKRPSLESLHEASIVSERVRSYPYESSTTPYKPKTFDSTESFDANKQNLFEAFSTLTSDSSLHNLKGNEITQGSPQRSSSIASPSSLAPIEENRNDYKENNKDQRKLAEENRTASTTSVEDPMSSSCHTRPSSSSATSKTTLDHVGQIADLRIIIKELKEKQSELERESSDKDKMIDKLKAESVDREILSRTLKEQINSQFAALKDREEKLDAAIQEINDLKSQLSRNNESEHNEESVDISMAKSFKEYEDEIAQLTSTMKEKDEYISRLVQLPPLYQRSDECMICKCAFNLFYRRHHCRACGKRNRIYFTIHNSQIVLQYI